MKIWIDFFKTIKKRKEEKRKKKEKVIKRKVVTFTKVYSPL